ncbi:MAG: hypothetical protein ABEK01_02170 [Candidatus Nanohaloarchaea archaeon]
MADSFVVSLLAGLAVFGVFFIASQGMPLGQEAPEKRQMIFTEQSFGTVGESNQDFRSIGLGSFKVGEGRGEVTAFRKDQARVMNKFLGGKWLSFKYNATSPKYAVLSFDVLGKSGPGKIYVKANGREVYKEKLVVTATPEIRISSQYLHPGINRFTVGTTKGGWFDSTSYRIEDVEAVVNDRKFSDHEDTFRLYDHEIANMVAANLSFTVPIGSSTPTKPLQVTVNGNTVFHETIGRSTQSVELTTNPSEGGLHTGMNTIKFSTEGESRYEIKNAEVTVRYVTRVSSGQIRTEFNMSRRQVRFADLKDTTEWIRFDFTSLLPSTNQMVVQVNDFSRKINPSGDVNVTIPEKTLKGENKIHIRSNGTYQLTDLKVLSTR